MKKLLLFVSALLTACSTSPKNNGEAAMLPEWKEGYLDIHTINTGRGNCQLIILPDSTTMMIDAGDFDNNKYRETYDPMTCSDPVPSSEESAAKAIADYVANIPGIKIDELDYFLLTHFHSDHYGQVKEGLQKSANGDYLLVGVTELNEYLPIKRLIDRGYPDYSYPVDMRNRVNSDGSEYDPTFNNYIRFVEARTQSGDMTAQKLIPGSNDQVKPLNKDLHNFTVRGIKCSDKLWSGNGEESIRLFEIEDVLSKNVKVKENQMSCAVVLEYGSFRYFAGGDNSGLVDQDHPEWNDIETPMAAVVGKVSAMTLNHHGNRDATNLNFLNTLDPKVVIMQTWSSDHPGQEVGQRLISKNVGTRERDIFMTYYHPQTSLGIGPWYEKEVKAMNASFVLRVYPDYHYEVFVLDSSQKEPVLISKYGPYEN